jgi:tellurite resistance protein
MRDHHRALVYTMVIVSAAESNMTGAEMHMIGEIVGNLPVFRDFDRKALPGLLEDCARLMSREDGLDDTIKAIRAGLPAKLRETAYAIACDLIAANGKASQEELQVLDLLRERLNVEQLAAVAIERGARARFQTL